MIGRWASLLSALCSLQLSCTVYTNCPEGQKVQSGTCASSANNPVGGDNGGDGNNGGGGAGVVPPDPSLVGPVPDGAWSNATGNLSGMPAGYANVCNVSAKPGEDLLIAGVSAAGLFGTRDGAESWKSIGTKSGSEAIANRPSAMVYDPDHPEVFWEAGSYGEGVFQTKDNGDTFVRLGMIINTDGLGVDFSDSKRQTLLASVHEHGHTLNRSLDGGNEWTDISDALPAELDACNYPVVVDTSTYLFGCSQYNTMVGGIYRTTDAGQTWSRVSPRPGWQTPLLASDHSIYWSLETDGGMVRSTDQGETWTAVASGTLTVHPIELPDGRIATVTKQYVVTSADHGKTWHIASPLLPIVPAGLEYAPVQKAFFIWYLSPDSAVPADSIMRFDFDFEVE